MTILEAYALFWRKAFDFKSRARRREYWFATLMNAFILFAIILTEMVLVSLSEQTAGSVSFVMSVLLYGFLIAIFIPSLSIGFRRYHDAGFKGLFSLLPGIMTVISCVYSIYMLILALSSLYTAEGPPSKTSFEYQYASEIMLLWFLCLLVTLVIYVFNLFILCKASVPDNKYGTRTKAS